MGLTGVSSDSWWFHLTQAIKAPDTPNNRSNLNAWAACEGGSATYNPFNTTLAWPGSTCMNSVCVRNYPNFLAGVSATADTILQSNMSPILRALRGNWNRQAFAGAIGSAPWGTSGSCVATAGGGGTGGAPGGTGPITGSPSPPPPPEKARDDWSGHIKRSASQFNHCADVADRYAKAFRHLRTH
jgi:hypothetical protein